MKNSQILFNILFFSVILSGTITAQNKLVDSLKNELSIHTQKNEKRVDLLNTFAFNYRRHDIKIAEEKAMEANILAKEIGYEKGIAKSILLFSEIHISKGEYAAALEDAFISLKVFEDMKSDNPKALLPIYSTLGKIYGYQNDPETSLVYFKKFLTIAQETEDLKSQGDGLANIGVTYYKKGEFGDAINYYKQAITIYEQMGNTRSALSTLNNVAVIASIQGRYTEALEYYSKLLLMYREAEEKDRIAQTLQNMGILYSDIDQPKKALTYFIESLKYHKEIESKHGVAINLNSIGSTHVDLNEYEKGLEYLTESLALNEEVKNNESLVSCHNAIAQVHIILKQPKLALSHLNSSLALGLAAGDKRNEGSAHINLAEVYLMLNEISKALTYAKKGEEIVYNLEMLPEQKQVNDILSRIYEAKGDYKNSLSHFKQFKTINDSLFNKENIEKITQLEYEYKYKQELELASLREMTLTKTVKDTTLDLEQSQRNLLLGVIGFLLLSLILVGIIFYLKLRNEKSKTQNIVIEQKLLRSQMTPHFIFNSLSVLQGMILNKENEKSVTYLSRFSKLLRIILENSRDKTVLLSQELAAVENYLALQNLENESYTYTVIVDKALNIEQLDVPPMLIQPFVENAIEHAFVNQNENRKIDVHLKDSNRMLICTITDNGIGIDTKKISNNGHKNSLATTITSERLKIVSKEFKMEGSVTIEDRKKYKEQGTIVTLVIPYHTKNV